MNRLLPLFAASVALSIPGRLDAQEQVSGDPSPAVHSGASAIDQKLKNIFISLDFAPGTTIEEAMTFLTIESKKLDPDNKGVRFIIQPMASTSAKPLSLTLNNVPLREAVRYVCLLANVKYKIDDYAISVVPLNQNTDELVTRTFRVQPNFVELPSSVNSSTDK
jgi:general secretion pathway protein D